ncbi:MAG: DUF3160 domain-containing protein [Bacillota bacterium]
MQKNRLVVLVLLTIFLSSILMGGCGKQIDKSGTTDAPPDYALESNGQELAKPDLEVIPDGIDGADEADEQGDVQEEMVSSNTELKLENTINRDQFKFSPEAEKLLIKNGFVVVPDLSQEFYIDYEMNSYDGTPNFITTDSMLHNYHLFFSHLLRVIEKEKLEQTLKDLAKSMLVESQTQYEDLKGSTWENAAKRNIGFFAVAAKLLDSKTAIPDEVLEEVKAELFLINKQEGIATSPLMNLGQDVNLLDAFKEDYSQYIPRGHYTGSEQLKSYFKAMMWSGRMTFRANNEDETRSAVLMTLALESKQNKEKWETIYEPTNFFVGKSDDLSYFEYKEQLEKNYGQDITLAKLVSDNEKWAAFMQSVGQLEGPALNSIPIFEEDLQADREQEIKGFRFMGQRYTLDGDIFQRLVYRDVKENDRGEKRLLPKALDIPAALGSKEAYSILKAQGDTAFSGYSDNMRDLQQYIAGLKRAMWTQNLYWGWLDTLRALITEKGEDYPSFMQNQAWQRKELTTFLSSWTELKHDTILYAKQVYAEMGGGGGEVDDRGYVEPNPELYGRLAALIETTKVGLSSRGLLNDRDQDSLDRLWQLAFNLKTISSKELKGMSLTKDEHNLIRSYGGQLEHFWLEALADEGVDHRSAISENPAALVADVATDPNGMVLQEATGSVYDIYVLVAVEGFPKIAKGKVYSHYEFIWPLEDRLTDKKWQGILNDGLAPPAADWTRAYISP